MKKLLSLVLIAVMLVTGCTTPDVKYTPIGTVNGCMIVAEGYKAAYDAVANQKPWFWSQVLIIQWNKQPRTSGPNSHAVALVEWKDKRGKSGIYAYDQIYGSFYVGSITLKDDPKALAAAWCGNRTSFLDAYFF